MKGVVMKRERLEFRYYEIPANEYIIAKIGPGWEQEYGVDEEPGVLHFHNYLEVGYCYRGHGKITVSDQIYRYSDEMFTLIPENIPHTTNSDKGNICKWEFLFIDISSFVENEMRDSRFSSEEIIKILNQKTYILWSETAPQLAKLIQLIFDEWRNQKPYFKESLKGYLRSFVIEMMRLADAREKEHQNQYYTNYTETALKYIALHYAEEIKVADIARNSGLSESHFRRVFEESTNMKPVDYLNMVRVNKACELMGIEEGSMADIGRRVGFQTASSFNRNFKQLTGITPLQWKIRELREGKNLKNYVISAKRGWEA